MNEDVRESVLKLEAMSAVQPSLAPVVKIALDVCRAAKEEVDEANERCAAAEKLVADVKPTLDNLAAQNEEMASRLAARSEIDAAESARERHEKRAAVAKAAATMDATEEQRFVAALAPIARQMAEQTAKTALLVEKLSCVHKYTRDASGRSAIQSMREHGEWRVIDNEGATISVHELRSDAVKAVIAQVELERGAEPESESANPEYPDDELHSPVPWRKKKPVRVEQPPEPTAAMESTGVSRTAKRKSRSRIL